VLWTLALMTRAVVESRTRTEAEEWVRSLQARLLEQVQGDRTVKEISERSLALLTESLRVPVGAIYASDGGTLRLAAVHGLRAGVDLAETIGPGEGLGGAAATSRRVTVLNGLEASAFPLRSAFLDTAPSCLAIVPLVADDVTEGVIELGLRDAPNERALAVFERVQHGLGVALRTATYRNRVRHLLAETQEQAENLRIQQEELRVTNEELEEHGRALTTSQVRLEEQQAELEATNAQLEAQALELEQQQGTLEIARQEAERASRYKSEFLANMSHELRTPLNSTLILARLLAQNKDGNLSEEQVRYAETIHTSGTTLLTLINDILDLSKVEAGAAAMSFEPTSVGGLVDTLERTFGPVAADKHLTFTIDLAPLAPAELVTDVQRLQQVLANLLSNAFKFTERGGVVLRVRAAGGDRVAFEVRDTGPGIEPDQHEVIFEAFRQADGSTHRRHGGTGLGLSISRQLARLLGGDITLQSTPGVGSTFTLVIPVQAPANASQSNRPAPPAAAAPARQAATAGAPPSTSGFSDDRDHRRHPGRLILVVEDDLAFARVLYDTAQTLDFDCVVATTNDEGMTLARQMVPSAILLDVQLPDGSGLTLLDRLKRSPDTRHIPVHVISAGDHAHTALALGAVGSALKPVRQEDLIDAIRRLESTLEQRVRRVLIVEDDQTLRASLVELIGQLDDVRIHDTGTARGALDELARTSFDCVILDLHLPDASGFDVLETMSTNEGYSFPPVIVYTGRPISPDEEQRLRQYSRSVIVKGARSPERLLAEVTLFLHKVESKLPPATQRLLRVARERDEFFEGRTVLIVEDDIRNVFALTSVFEPLGASVTIARNGVEALQALDRSRPDIVLMDIMMPEMDGLTAMRHIRERHELRTLPIIALTAKAMPDDYQECLAAGANDYLAKPLDVDKLVSLCRVWMAR
jgi:signal transduction histidine kinase/CheY-like chemotaxis protein